MIPPASVKRRYKEEQKLIERLLPAIKAQIESLFGEARFYLKKETDVNKPITKTKKKTSFDGITYYCSLYRGYVPLTEFEQTMFRELVKALDVLYNGF